MSDSYTQLPFVEGRRRRRWLRALGLGAMLIIVVGLLWARTTKLRSGDDAALRDGAQALARAVKGDRASFAVAREHFKRAARAVVWDGYPVFVMDLTDQLERGNVRVTDDRIRPVMSAVGKGQVTQARAALAALPKPDQDRFAWLGRLLEAMAAEVDSDTDRE